MWLSSTIGNVYLPLIQPAFALFRESSYPWKRTLIPTSIFFSLMSKISFEVHNPNLWKTPMQFVWSLCENIDKVGNVLHSAFSSVTLWCSQWINWCKHAVKWPLNDHSSMHYGWGELCGFVVTFVFLVCQFIRICTGNYTSASLRVQFIQRKIKRIHRPTRLV